MNLFCKRMNVDCYFLASKILLKIYFILETVLKTALQATRMILLGVVLQKFFFRKSANSACWWIFPIRFRRIFLLHIMFLFVIEFLLQIS